MRIPASRTAARIQRSGTHGGHIYSSGMQRPFYDARMEGLSNIASTPSTLRFPSAILAHAPEWRNGRRGGLKNRCLTTCEFDSRLGHHFKR